MRTLDQAHRGALAHLPPGWAWTREQDSATGRALRPLAEEAVRFEERAEALLEEGTPGTSAELLPDYERVLGPDPCMGPVRPGLQERRLSARMRWTMRGGASRRHFIEVAATLGYAITITEFAPARVGRFRVGRPLYPLRARFTWRVGMPATRVVRFRTGRSRTGDRLADWGVPPLRCVFSRQAPIHTTLIFANSPSAAP